MLAAELSEHAARAAQYKERREQYFATTLLGTPKSWRTHQPQADPVDGVVKRLCDWKTLQAWMEHLGPPCNGTDPIWELGVMKAAGAPQWRRIAHPELHIPARHELVHDCLSAGLPPHLLLTLAIERDTLGDDEGAQRGERGFSQAADLAKLVCDWLYDARGQQGKAIKMTVVPDWLATHDAEEAAAHLDGWRAAYKDMSLWGLFGLGRAGPRYDAPAYKRQRAAPSAENKHLLGEGHNLTACGAPGVFIYPHDKTSRAAYNNVVLSEFLAYYATRDPTVRSQHRQELRAVYSRSVKMYKTQHGTNWVPMVVIPEL